MMSKPMNFETYKANLVRHELGHWFVARSLGFEVGEIAVEVKRGVRMAFGHRAHSHIDLHPSLRTLEEASGFLAKRISVLWAGVAFQSTLDTRGPDVIRDTDAADDHAKLRELAFVLRGIRFPNDNVRDNELDQLQAICDESWMTAKNIIETNIGILERLAARMGKVILKANFRYVFGAPQLTQWLG